MYQMKSIQPLSNEFNSAAVVAAATTADKSDGNNDFNDYDNVLKLCVDDQKNYNDNDDDDYIIVVTFGCFADNNGENVFKKIKYKM